MQLADLKKATASDTVRLLSSEVYKKYSSDESFATYLDHDETFVYTLLYYDESRYTIATVYSMQGMVVTLADDFHLVEMETTYTEINKTESTEDLEMEKSTVPSKSECLLVKEFPNQMQVVECLYIAIDDIDGVGDAYASPEVCYDMVESFNKAISEGRMAGNYFHHPDLNTEDFKPVKAWVTETDCYIGETFVKKGQPLVLNQFYNIDAYNLRRQGEFCGVSIGAKASWEEVH